MATRKLNPIVLWAQDEKNIYLRIDLVDVQNIVSNLEPTSLTFSCQGTGAQGNNKYSFLLNFYDHLDTNESSYKLSDKCVSFKIVKNIPEWWPRLTSKPQKPHWLKIDFDRWQSPDEFNDKEHAGDILNDHADIFQQLQKEEIGYRKEDMMKVYLTFYNFFMYLGFLYIIIVLLMKLLRDGTNAFSNAFESVGVPMYIVQAVQLMEIVHPILGIMKGGPLIPFLQIAGRIFQLFFMIGDEPRVQNQSAVFVLFLVWSTIEIIRYPYYITQVHKKNNKMLEWLRYNAWIILYPVGFACELIVTFMNVIYIDQSHKWSIEMPNSLNFIFNSAFLLRTYMMFGMFPGIFMLLSHMYKARRQKLGSLKMKTKF